MGRKHAFLIIAHADFEVLERLIRALDDVRNDIYIHFDKKVKSLPIISTDYASLYIIKDRIDVRWGDYSQIEVELKVFEEAYKHHHYAYYHLLSGVDMLLLPQDRLHDFFIANDSKEFIGFSNYNYSLEIEKKVRRYHLFPRNFKSSSLLQKIVRFGFIRLQNILGLRRNTAIDFKKGTNWISITDNFVEYILSQKEEIKKIYHNTFCADEIFIHTLCWNSPFKNAIYNLEEEGEGAKRAIRWRDGQLIDWTMEDYDYLVSSDKIFARKFNVNNLDVVDKLLKSIKDQ